jgi:type I restriction enzyme S subunit
MNRWKQIKLGSVASFRNVLNFNASARGVGLAMGGVGDFKDRSFVQFDGLEELQPEVLSTPDALIRKDDLLFVRSNGNRNLIGRSLFVLDDPPKPTSYSGFTIRLRFHDERVVPGFYAYLLRGAVTRRLLSSQGGGTNINNLNQSILDNLDVPLPPPETQRRIAAILGAYDDLLEINRRRIVALEEMASGLFVECSFASTFRVTMRCPCLRHRAECCPLVGVPGPWGIWLKSRVNQSTKALRRTRPSPISVFPHSMRGSRPR